MTKLLPQNFPPLAPTSIASYSYTDIAEGTGMVKFQGYLHMETTTESYGLTTTNPYSHFIWTTIGVTEANYTLYIDKDFDLSPFAFPREIKGTARFNVTLCSGDAEPAAY